MSKIEFYIEKLKSEKDWIKFLKEESCLPGPRSNLELLAAVSIAGNENLFKELITIDKGIEINNSPEGFLVMCGIAGIGRTLTRKKANDWNTLKQFASHPGWRIRESVAMGLQYFGSNDMDFLIEKMEEWTNGNLCQKRAAIAALCEPGLLNNNDTSKKVLNILYKVTRSIVNYTNSKDEQFTVLKKGLGYCWSVAIVSNPSEGKKAFEEILSIEDKNVRWIVKENLKKKRLMRIDKNWVEECLSRI